MCFAASFALQNNGACFGKKQEQLTQAPSDHQYRIAMLVVN